MVAYTEMTNKYKKQYDIENEDLIWNGLFFSPK